MTMLPDDDFLLFKPARRESAAILKISLMAVMGCLMLLSVLVLQARAKPDAAAPLPAAAVQAIPDHPLQSYCPAPARSGRCAERSPAG